MNSAAKQSRGNYTRIVENQKLVTSQKRRKLHKLAVLAVAGLPVKN